MTFSILASTSSSLKFVIRLRRVPGALSMTRTVWRPCSVPQSAQRVTAAACAHLGTGWTEKQHDLQIDEANKNYLRNTDHFKLITSNLNLNERLCDSPVPWHCRAECQLISFKAAMADHVCISGTWKIPVRPGAPRRSSHWQCGPTRLAKFPDNPSFNQRFLEKILRKIRYF
jgi:hypothetical protein